ncbi:amino acid ABC transporter substrate-binding protein [Tropicimonas sp. IMCC34011]|uniref:amino acid ABC transporter substrate-binding protein n=1 Tax=Tropicimonas sp. IMCC34011 TaxID=2248759 RepID=UPI000E26C45E|nr:amino acid ABC transporter substrate-binding protein [Tropicimonas sp. IMCC34011]
MRGRRSLASAALATAIALTATGAAVAQEPITIGYSIARTGIYAAAAPSQENPYKLWQKQVNAAGGLELPDGEQRPVEFVSYDDQSNPANTVRIYEKLITQDEVDLLAAPWGTPMHLALAPVLQRFKMPMVGNTAASVQLRNVAPGYIWFPTSAIPDAMGAELAKMMQAEGVKSAALLANELPYSQEFRSFLIPALEEAGIEVMVDESYPPDIKDMTSMLVEVRDAAPDAVVAMTYPSDAFLFAGQAKELGIEASFVMSLIGPTIDAYRKANGSAVNGMVSSAHWSPEAEDWPRGQAFFDAYVEEFGEEPDALDSALAYMSLEILQQAVAEAGLEPEALRDEIASGTFDTINGEVRFEGVQNVVTPTGFVQIQDGKIELVWPESVATADFAPKQGW